MDLPKIRKYKMVISLFASVIMLAIVCLMISFSSYRYAISSQMQEYEYLMDVARKAGSQEDKTKFYLNAIDTDSSRVEAYDELIDLFLEDGVFDDNEESTLVDICVSTEKYFNSLEKTALEDYADLCFKIGNAYWFYYNHEESRQSAAVAWFEGAATGYSTLEDRNREFRRCNIYKEIGGFYKKVIQAQIEGTDADMYGEYWKNLLELKALNDENPDREFITLRLYEEIITRSMEYGKYLREDGITKEEIDTTYDDILYQINLMSDNATQKVKEETDNIILLISQARRMLNSNYKEV
jgi:serine/threonine-protein kinase